MTSDESESDNCPSPAVWPSDRSGTSTELRRTSTREAGSVLESLQSNGVGKSGLDGMEGRSEQMLEILLK